MHNSVSGAFLAGFVLVIILLVPAAAGSSTISSISPVIGYTGTTTTVTITGSDFNTSSIAVRLMMDDESNISATISSHTSTSIVCKFTLSSSRTKGVWDLVVVNEDESEVVDSEAFTIRSPLKLTTITPATAKTNDDIDFTLDGSGLANVEDVYLYNEDYNNVSATLDDVSAADITGTFDMAEVDVDDYEVCVVDDFGTRKCGLSFEVTTDNLGEIDISSSPTGASIYVDSEYMGTTPYIVTDQATGYHKVKLVKTGYDDWEKLIKVAEGETTTIEAGMNTITLVTTQRTPDPAVATTIPTTMPTKRVTSSITVPTPWPTSTTTTQASPTGTPGIISALLAGIGIFAVSRKK